MTKSYKATHFWMYRYDKRYTLFVYQIYKKSHYKPTTTQNQSVKISAIRGKNHAQHSATNPINPSPHKHNPHPQPPVSSSIFCAEQRNKKCIENNTKKTNLLKIASKEVIFYKYFKILVFY